MPWVVAACLTPFALIVILLLAEGALRHRRAFLGERALEREKSLRLARDQAAEEERITASILLAGPARALVAMLELVGVEGVYIEAESDVFYVLALEGADARALAALKDTVRWSTPIGLRSVVVVDRDGIPAQCVPIRRGIAA